MRKETVEEDVVAVFIACMRECKIRGQSEGFGRDVGLSTEVVDVLCKVQCGLKNSLLWLGFMYFVRIYEKKETANAEESEKTERDALVLQS